MLICAFLLISQEIPAWIPSDLLDLTKFEMVGAEDQEIVGSARFLRFADESTVYVNVTEGNEQMTKTRMTFSSASPHRVLSSRDGLMFSPAYVSSWTETTAYSTACGSYDLVRVSIAGPPRNENGERRTETRPFDRDVFWLENMARITLVRWATRRLEAAPITARIGDSALPAWKSRQGATLIDLTAASQALGFTITLNDAKTCATFTHGGRHFTAPLGAESVKVNEAWHPMPDVVMQKEGRFLVPVEAFASEL